MQLVTIMIGCLFVFWGDEAKILSNIGPWGSDVAMLISVIFMIGEMYALVLL